MPTLLQLAALNPDAQKRLQRDCTVINRALPEVDGAWLAENAPSIDVVVTGGHLGIPNALVEALRDGTIAGAALDVFEDEPNVPPALHEMDHVVTTPQTASGTHETRRAMGELMLDNLDAFLAGKQMPAPVV